MTSEVVTLPFYISDEDKHVMRIEPDAHTSDELLKHKSRSMNLIMHNPNLFRNKTRGSFTEIIGGQRALLTILLCGGIGLGYRLQVNKLRNVTAREGIWFCNVYFWYGCGVGAFYSAMFFWNWQRQFNDMCANFLLKRYSGCANLRRRNIYKMKDHENEDECYRFTSTYANSFHF